MNNVFIECFVISDRENKIKISKRKIAFRRWIMMFPNLPTNLCIYI